MQKLTKILTAFGLSAVLALPAGAEFEQTGNQSVRVSGTGEAGTMVTLQVFKGGNAPLSLKDLPDGTTYLDILVCHDQTKVGANGKYTFDFNIDGATGTYTAYTSFEGNGAPTSETVYFINEEEVKSVLQELHDADVATSAEKQDGDTCVEDIIRDSHKASVLGFTDAKGIGINNTSLAKILYNYINKDGSDFTHDDRNAAIAVYEQCLFVQRLNENKIGDIFDEYTLSHIDTSEVKDWVTKPFVGENLKKEMTAKLSGKGFESIDAYKEKITEAFVLAAVRYPNGYTNLENVLKEFYAKIGINLSDITGDICSTLSGGTYDSYSTLKIAFEALLPPDVGGSDDGGTDDGGGGGGGGGGTGGKDKKPIDIGIQAPVTPVNPTPVPENPFNDLGEVSWAEEAIASLADKGIVNGKGDGKFSPNDMVTREEFTKMIVEALNVEANGEISFNDVDKNAWYHSYISKAYGANIIKGMDALSFGIGRNITRQDMAVICLNAAKNAGIGIPEMSDEAFSDDNTISDYAKNAVYTLKEMQIIGGMGNNRYEPQGFATRAQAAVIIYRLLSI